MESTFTRIPEGGVHLGEFTKRPTPHIRLRRREYFADTSNNIKTKQSPILGAIWGIEALVQRLLYFLYILEPKKENFRGRVLRTANTRESITTSNPFQGWFSTYWGTCKKINKKFWHLWAYFIAVWKKKSVFSKKKRKKKATLTSNFHIKVNFND